MNQAETMWAGVSRGTRSKQGVKTRKASRNSRDRKVV